MKRVRTFASITEAAEALRQSSKNDIRFHLVGLPGTFHLSAAGTLTRASTN